MSASMTPTAQATPAPTSSSGGGSKSIAPTGAWAIIGYMSVAVIGAIMLYLFGLFLVQEFSLEGFWRKKRSSTTRTPDDVDVELGNLSPKQQPSRTVHEPRPQPDVRPPPPAHLVGRPQSSFVSRAAAAKSEKPQADRV